MAEGFKDGTVILPISVAIFLDADFECLYKESY